MIGKTISHYKINEKIGEGGMGVVYKAEDTKLKRTVALKFLPPEFSRDKDAKDRFFVEAQAAAGLSHSNIVTVHEIDEYALLEVPEYNFTNDYLNGLIDGSNFMPYFHAARSVTNAAIGVNKNISPKLSVLGGLRTDFTSGDLDNIRFLGDKFKINQIHFNKYHFTLGPVLSIKQFDVLTGIQYTYARNRDISSIINYAQPVEYIPQTEQALEGLRQNAASASVNEIALFFGLTVGFFK